MKQESILFALKIQLKEGPYVFCSMIVFRINSMGRFTIVCLDLEDFVEV